MDAEEIARLVKDLRVSGGPSENSVTITKDEAAKGQKRLERVVVGKIFSRQVITREMVRSNLPRILRIRGTTEIEVVGQNLFVISFSLESDKRVALEDGPWHFFQDLMILKQTQPMQTAMEVEFNEITLWVQCHNVPLECMEPTIIERIGEQVGKVSEVDVGEGGLCVGKFARVRVTRSIDKPLLRCVPLKQEGLDKDVLVVLQYEKLPDFCFSCGRVGHIARDCGDESVDKQHPRFDSWLRAGRTFVGRREVGTSNRPTGRSSSPGDSGSRWLEIRSESRVEVNDKRAEATGEIESQPVGGKEVIGAEQVAMENVTDSPDVCMTDPNAVLTLISSARRETGVMGRPSERKEKGGEGVGGQDQGNGTGGGGKVKSGEKGWKRLARERRDEGDQVGGSGAPNGMKSGSLKRRATFLRDEEEEADAEGEGKRMKKQQVDETTLTEFATAEAAAQPRRSL